GLEQDADAFDFEATGRRRNPGPTLSIIVAWQILRRSHELTWVQSMVSAEGQPKPLQRTGGSHDHIRTALYRPPRIEGCFGVLSDAISVDRWSPGEIHKHIVARSLLCDQPSSSICWAACSSTFGEHPADRRNTPHPQSLLPPGLPRRVERRSERKFGSWRRVFLLGNS